MSWKLVRCGSVASAIGILASSAVAQPPPGGPGGERPRQPPPFMAALDVNSDGSIDQDELLMAVESLKTLDKDKDGKLSMSELAPPREGGGGPGGPGGPGGGPGGPGGPGGGFGGRPGGGFGGGFDVMSNDKNKDGFVTKDEYMQDSFAQMDTNSDGKISKEESEAAAAAMRQRFAGGGGPGGGGPGNFDIMSNDKNKDGYVTKDELPEPLQRMMERVDTNSDGKISKEEADTAMERFRQGGGRGGDRGDRGGDRPQRPRDDA